MRPALPSISYQPGTAQAVRTAKSDTALRVRQYRLLAPMNDLYGPLTRAVDQLRQLEQPLSPSP